MQWLIESKEWLFSGIGVLLISIIFTFLKRKKDHITQSIKDSDRNVNIQAGDNTNITLGTSDKEEPKKDLNPCLNPHAKYVDNLTDYFEGCDDKTPAKIEIAVDDRGQVILFHSLPLKVHLKRVEYFVEESRLQFVSDRNTSRYFGAPLGKGVAEYLEKTNIDKILMIRLNEKTMVAEKSGMVELKTYK